MKNLLFFLSILWLTACIETDLVKDEVITLNIIPSEGELINNSDLSGFIGDSKTLDVTASNDRGKTFVPTVDWSSSDVSVATVDENGTLSLIGKGTSSIKAIGFDLESNVINLSVASDANEVTLVEIAEVNTTLAIGASIQLSASALNANQQELEGKEITWTSSNENVVEVTQDGLATAIANGTAILTATADEATGSLIITVGESNRRSGEFKGLRGYTVDGNVELSNDNDELQLILQDNFSASNGPGLYLYLSNNETTISGGIEIGKLEKNSGADTYTVPSGITIDQYNHVLVYCKPFGVSFGTAELN